MAKNFKEYSKQLNLSEINKEMLKLWDANSLFETSMKEREGCPTFVFLRVPLPPMVCPASITSWRVLLKT